MSEPEFKPSEDQQRVLAAFQDTGYTCTVRDACGRNESLRVQSYRWFRDAQFRAWWNEERERYFAMQLPRVDAAVLSAAVGEGSQVNVSAARLMYERHDQRFAPRQRREIETSGETSITIEEAIKRFDAAVPDKPA